MTGKKPNRMSGALSSHPFASTVVQPPAPLPEPPAVPASMPESMQAVVGPEPGPKQGHIKISELGPTPYKAGGRRPAADLADAQPVRLTAYLTEPQVRALRSEVHRRQSKGRRADLSMLLREAVDAYLTRPTR
jgi:hypothetical protein